MSGKKYLNFIFYRRVNRILNFYKFFQEYLIIQKQWRTKYKKDDGTSGANDTHHFEVTQSSGDTSVKIEVYKDSALYTGDQDFYSNSTAITNYEYEERLQDQRRKIRLLDPRYLDDFVSEFKLLMKESMF